MSDQNNSIQVKPQGPSDKTVAKDSLNMNSPFSSPELETGKFELDENSKFDALKGSRHGLKQCMQAFQALPNKTRQALRILLVILVSTLLLVAIIYITRLADNENVIDEPSDLREIPDVIRSPQIVENDAEEKYGFQPDEEGSLRVPVEVFKDMQGKAREYDRIHKEGRLPIRPHSITPYDMKKIKLQRKMRKHPANATEIKQTLDMLRKRVDLRRKEISSKELRLWEPGTEPLRILIVSTWRSGSTFLSETIGSHPGVFQHFEPLAYVGVKQVRSGKEAFEAQQLVHQLLDCDYEGTDKYMETLRRNPSEFVGHNSELFQICNKGPNPQTCLNTTFLADACKMFPIQTVKTVRMRLNMTQLLLNDEKLWTKVVFLVRDPRGTMSSRYSSVTWCTKSPDCSSPATLCDDIQGDLKVAAAFEKLYPDRFVTLKYEDLSLDPVKETVKLFTFLGLEFTDSTASFLEEHTQENKDAAWSTKRKSSDRISLWKKQLPLEEIHDVQNSCAGVIKSLNYEIFGE